MAGEGNNAAGGKGPGSLVKRIIAAAVFIPCLIVISRRGGIYFLLLVEIIILTGLWEFYRMMQAKGLSPYRWVGMLGGAALPWYLFFRQGIYGNLLLGLTFLGVMIVELFRREKGHSVYHVSVTIFGVIYISWLGSHLIMLRELPLITGVDYSRGFDFIMTIFVLTWFYDTGAYTAGRLFGRRKLFPSISPGKTVEGAIGGLIMSIAGILAARAFIEIPVGHVESIGLAAGLSVAGQLGDLSESMIKRDVQIKDSSKTIPGHGGALDRFDSILFTAPIFYYILRYFILE